MPLMKRKAHKEPEISNATVADISFLLLIFFIVSTGFLVEQGMVLGLPSGEKGATAQVSRKNILEIEAHSDNSITVKGQRIQVEDIRELAANAQDANPKLIVVIQTSGQARYETMIDILDELKMADIKKISLKMKG